MTFKFILSKHHCDLKTTSELLNFNCCLRFFIKNFFEDSHVNFVMFISNCSYKHICLLPVPTVSDIQFFILHDTRVLYFWVY